LKLKKKELEEKIISEEYQRAKKLSDINTIRNKLVRPSPSTGEGVFDRLQSEAERKEKELDDLTKAMSRLKVYREQAYHDSGRLLYEEIGLIKRMISNK